MVTHLFQPGGPLASLFTAQAPLVSLLDLVMRAWHAGLQLLRQAWCGSPAPICDSVGLTVCASSVLTRWGTNVCTSNGLLAIACRRALMAA